MNKPISEVAESLLGRKLNPKDGVNTKMVEETEQNLGVKFPESLKSFWLTVGNVDMFTIPFNEFYELDELELIGDYLPFVSENQGVCIWAININDKSANPKVYQSGDYDTDKPTWYEENLNLNEFLSLMLYFQCAEGGYEFGGETNDKADIKTVLNEAETNWDKVVDHNGLVIYQNNQVLIWYIAEQNGEIDMVLCSALNEGDCEKIEKQFNFSGF